MFQSLKSYLDKHIEISDDQFSAICKKFKLKKTKRNEIILEAGSICRHMFFVNKGCLRVFLVDDAGKESTRFLISEGRFGTSFPSFILQEPSQAFIQSIEPSEILF